MNSLDLSDFKRVLLNLAYGSKKDRKHRWSLKYKKSINCSNPKGFSQKQYCKRLRRGGKYKSTADGIENVYDIVMSADKNKAIRQLQVYFPEIFEGILRNYPEVLFQGLEDLDESILPNMEKIYFLTTPEAVWIIDRKGKIIGEEESGFADLKYTKYNPQMVEIIKQAKSLI